MEHQFQIQVCGVDELREQIQQGAKSVVSIWDTQSPDEEEMVKLLRHQFPGDCLHLVRFDDVVVPTPGRRAATIDDIGGILRFAADAPSPLLVHCFVGASRSTAAAYAILCQYHGAGEEENCMQELLRIRPYAAPNSLIVDIADEVLNRGGALKAAYEKILELHLWS